MSLDPSDVTFEAPLAATNSKIIVRIVGGVNGDITAASALLTSVNMALPTILP